MVLHRKNTEVNFDFSYTIFISFLAFFIVLKTKTHKSFYKIELKNRLMLIVFVLLKPNKFENIATMLQAVTGKSKDSIIEQLKDTHRDGLYSFQNIGELNQLIVTLTNLSEIFRSAGFRSIANMADKKLRELERMKIS